MITIAINGFGRIGRNFLRALLQDKSIHNYIRIGAINIGPASIDMVAHMFKHDTLMGTFVGVVSLHNNQLVIDNVRIPLIAQRDPSTIDWHMFDIDWVVESSGHFTHREGAQKHLNAGARFVLITAPAKNEDVSIIPGVNEKDFDGKKHKLVSLGSCTTNALFPMMKVLHEAFGIKQGFMTTVHAYTNTQVLLDVEDSDPRRCRAAALNIIPTSTGASAMIARIFPDLANVIHATSLRVPVAKVSLIDFTVLLEKKVTVNAIHDAFKHAKKSMPGIVDITMEPLVSSDYSGNSYSVVIDGLMTQAHTTMAKIFGWYDNEWGYSVRLKDFLMMVARNSF